MNHNRIHVACLVAALLGASSNVRADDGPAEQTEHHDAGPSLLERSVEFRVGGAGYLGLGALPTIEGRFQYRRLLVGLLVGVDAAGETSTLLPNGGRDLAYLIQAAAGVRLWDLTLGRRSVGRFSGALLGHIGFYEHETEINEWSNSFFLLAATSLSLRLAFAVTEAVEVGFDIQPGAYLEHGTSGTTIKPIGSAALLVGLRI